MSASVVASPPAKQLSTKYWSSTQALASTLTTVLSVTGRGRIRAIIAHISSSLNENLTIAVTLDGQTTTAQFTNTANAPGVVILSAVSCAQGDYAGIAASAAAYSVAAQSPYDLCTDFSQSFSIQVMSTNTSTSHTLMVLYELEA